MDNGMSPKVLKGETMEVVEDPAFSSVCGDRFPLEMWKIILQQFYDLDKDMLWSLRKICKNLKHLVDQVLQQKLSLWKQNEFPLDGTDVSWTNLLKSVKATRISSEVDAVKFIGDMGNYEGSPFPNGTLILSQYCGSATTMLDILRRISSIYGNHIICLAYSLPDSSTVTNDIFELSEILSLRNLQSLAIHKRDWAVGCPETLAKLYYTEPFPRTQSDLKELQIFGKDSAIPVSFLFPLFKNAVENVTHLKASQTPVAFATFSMTFLKKLEIFPVADNATSNPFKHLNRMSMFKSLKFVNLTTALLKTFLLTKIIQEFPFLEEVNLKYVNEVLHDNQQRYFEERFRFDVCELLTALSSWAPSLQKLTIDIDKEPLIHASPFNLAIIPATGEPKYLPKLTHLIIKLTTVILWKNLMKYLTNNKMPNLKRITLIIEDYSDVAYKSPKEFYDYLTTNLRQLFPDGLEIIHVPWFGWKLRIGQLPHSNFSIHS